MRPCVQIPPLAIREMHIYVKSHLAFHLARPTFKATCHISQEGSQEPHEVDGGGMDAQFILFSAQLFFLNSPEA